VRFGGTAQRDHVRSHREQLADEMASQEAARAGHEDRQALPVGFGHAAYVGRAFGGIPVRRVGRYSASSCSTRFRSVMSREIPMVPIMFPP